MDECKLLTVNTYFNKKKISTDSNGQRRRVKAAESSVGLLQRNQCRQGLFQQWFYVPVPVVVFDALERQYGHTQRICKQNAQYRYVHRSCTSVSVYI